MELMNFTRKQAAEAGNMSLPTLDSYLRRKEFPLPHFRSGKKVFIPVDGFREWLAAEAMREVNHGGTI